ncbi:unnamed protein product [Mytilus edulis]|uniref:Uncharacterized protein n=1 Tax=Mytilus edulis TaxID=6550 RepID=A0A8S3QR78_MYTED|nr:unnamed protein product [Mytilus edulis]
MGIWQIFALSSVINGRIFSVYQDCDPIVPQKVLHRLIIPRIEMEPNAGTSISNEVYVKWTSTRNDMTTENWVPYYFVPLINAELEADEIILDEDLQWDIDSDTDFFQCCLVYSRQCLQKRQSSYGVAGAIKKMKSAVRRKKTSTAVLNGPSTPPNNATVISPDVMEELTNRVTERVASRMERRMEEIFDKIASKNNGNSDVQEVEVQSHVDNLNRHIPSLVPFRCSKFDQLLQREEGEMANLTMKKVEVWARISPRFERSWY